MDNFSLEIVTLSVSNIMVNEADGHAEFVVRLNAPATANVSVRYNTDSGTTSSTTDYVGLAGTLNFAPGVTTQTVRVALRNDSTPEGLESLFLKLYSPSANVILANNVVQATIVDDDSGRNQFLDTVLDNLGITRPQAAGWVVQNLNAPNQVYNVLSSIGFSSNMFAELLQPYAPEIQLTGVLVNDWLQGNGQPALM